MQGPAGCYFYHSIDLPGFGLQKGDWDLRDDIDEYLGRQRFEGKLVVDVGTASGYLTIELERRGANVISFDRDPDDFSDDMGLVPYADYESRFGYTLDHAIKARSGTMRELQSSYWLTHRLFDSKARLYSGNAYEGLVGVDAVDVSLFGSILLHLRDPLLALTRFGRITRETIIITDTLENLDHLRDIPVMLLRPTVSNSVPGTWFWPTPAAYRAFLEVLGFRRFTYTEHQAMHVTGGSRVPLYTLVAHRS